MPNENLLPDPSLSFDDIFGGLNISYGDEPEESDRLSFDDIFGDTQTTYEESALPFDDIFKDVEVAEEEKQENPLSIVSQSSLEEDDMFIENEQEKIKRDPGTTKRFVSNFLEGLSPIPIDLTSDYQPAEDLTDKVAGVVGQVAGFGARLFATGGVVGGLKIIGTGAKATKALATASKGYTRAEKLRKQAAAAKTLKGRKMLFGKANAQELLIDKAMSSAGVIKNNTLLGKQEFYKKFITRMGADDYGVGKFLSRVKGVKASGDDMAIRAANALDLGITNTAASLIMFQKAIPGGLIYNDEGEVILGDRITKPIMDGMLLTLGGLPRVLGAGKIGNLALTSKAGKAVEAPFVFATGMGASSLGLGIQGEGERTFSDNLLDGAIFTAAHYIGVGADNMRVKHALREGLDGIISDPKAKKKISQAMSNDIIDDVRLYLSTKRPEYLRRRFVSKENSDELIQMTSITETKGGDHVVGFQYLMSPDDMTGKFGSIKGTTKESALSAFYKQYSSVLPDSKQLSKSYLKKNPYTLIEGSKLRAKSPNAYKEHQDLVNSIVKKEDKFGISRKEGYLLRRNAFKGTHGNTDKMSIEQLNTYKEMLSANKTFKNINKATLDSVLPFRISDEYLTKKKSFSAIREHGFSYEKNLSSFGVSGSDLARRVIDVADTKNITLGAFTKFRADLARDFDIGGIVSGGKKFDSITAILDDDKLKLIADDITSGKIKDGKILKQKVRDFFDNTFVELARHGAKIQVSKKKFSPLLRLYDKSGKIVKVSDKSFDNGDILKILRKKGTSVINKDGKKVFIDLEKSMKNSTYVDDYVPHYLSEKALKIFNKDNDSFGRNLRLALSSVNKNATQDEIDEIVGAYLQFADSNKPLGILNTRKVDIPPYMLIEKGTNRVIQLDEIPKLSTLKKGMSIEDMDGQSRVIGDVIEIYEKDFGKILDRYSNQVANSMALFKNFDEKGVSGKIAKRLIGGIEREAGKTQANYAGETLSLLLEGEAPTPWSSFGEKMTTAIANMYLSGGSAVIKNFATGQTQNWTSFGTKKLFKSYYRYIADRKYYRELTDEIGAVRGNVDELAFVYKSIPGRIVTSISAPFRFIERINRRASVAVTDVTMRDSFEALLTKKNTAFFNNGTEARKTLKDIMNLSDENIDYMLSKMKTRSRYGDKAFDLAMESDGKFKDLYKRALYKSQASTQGVTQLPYIPTWMAKNNLKPLTLFYRTAYRVTENTYNRALVPFVTEGNPFPLMRFGTGGILGGKVLYDWYYGQALGKDLLGKDFKKVPLEYFDYAVRGDALGLSVICLITMVISYSHIYQCLLSLVLR